MLGWFKVAKGNNRMAMTPIPSGSTLLIEAEEENNPKTVLNAYLVSGEGEAETYTEIASSFYSEETPLENQQHFLWAMSSLAEFHNVSFTNETGIKAP